MYLMYDELLAHAEERQRALRREAEVARMLRRAFESGRTLRVVLPPIPWPRANRQLGDVDGGLAA
jgi:nucleotide-binding universal stress UspA family protein